MACDWPVSATNGSTATLHGRELPSELPVHTLCTALAETAFLRSPTTKLNLANRVATAA